MKEIGIGQAQRLSAPCPFALLGTRDAAGRENLMAVSWWTYLSNHPAMLGVCLSNRGYSGELIRQSGAFTLCLVSEALRAAALACGQCSGRDTDKPARFGIATVPGRQVAAPLVRESRLGFECRLRERAAAGDHSFYIADIVAIYGNEDIRQLFAFDGYSRLDTVEEG